MGRFICGERKGRSKTEREREIQADIGRLIETHTLINTERDTHRHRHRQTTINTEKDIDRQSDRHNV